MSLLTRKRPHPASRIPPKFSIIVVVYDMPMQAMNTLYTLSREYQRDVDNVAYEVIVVENLSKRSLRRRQVEALGAEFRYIAREEPGVSPVGALVDGLAKARGEVVGIMVDGARMVTPGILRNVADAYRAFPNAVVATPGFHIGDEDHQHSRDRGHDEEVERELLASIPWKENGYLLYEVSAISGANPWGYLHPMMESNCMFGRREAIERIGWPDPRFDQPGGGVVNLDLYRELVELPESQLIVLPGEASFHQYHGGVTTRQDDNREPLMAQFRDRYVEIRGKEFHAPLREPVLLGTVSAYALPLLHYSAVEGRDRFEGRMRRQTPLTQWTDDPVVINTEILNNPMGEYRSPLGDEGNEMSIYLPPSVRHFHPRHLAFSTWVDHIQFGYDLVAAMEPHLLVELGTQGGLSYFAMCQSVDEHDLDTLCYAVDTWEGEQHTGAYDESVWESVSEVNRLNYPGFSYLLRMYFHEALVHFEDESIDLLHIDGLHTYDAVSEDFKTWEPKVAPGGIILFHDIKARLKDFGVWRFWDELKQESQETFEFRHGFGLGVWRKPGGPPPQEPLLRYMFDSTPGVQDDLRRFYVHAAMFHDYRRLATGGS
ncbi:MAG: class I SAM-dependent methyltransferase [Candidatus Nanopelagicales bacterium]